MVGQIKHRSGLDAISAASALRAGAEGFQRFGKVFDDRAAPWRQADFLAAAFVGRDRHPYEAVGFALLAVFREGAHDARDGGEGHSRFGGELG